MKKIFIPTIALLFLLISCNSRQDVAKITDLNDYEKFLTNESTALLNAKQENEFWSNKLDKDSTRVSVLSKLAATNTSLFTITGKIEYLKTAEKLLKKAIVRSSLGKTNRLRSLAHNYITQHKFKEAKETLNEAYAISKERESELMFFDVYMELGDYSKAKVALDKVKNISDFNYLIRLAKWMDYKGDLDGAITYFEKAVNIAQASKLDGVTNWSYSNLADYYGHAGKLEASYNYYLKALEINPNDIYALKKIAWLLFSHEKNSQMAYMVLNSLKEKYESPDLYLMEMEIAAFEGDDNKQFESREAYYKLLTKKDYGDMYNKYNALLYIDDEKDFQKAFAIAQKEIENRPTPQSYDLLAWTYFNKGEYDKAFQISQEFIYGKTYEPETLYHQAEIFKAQNKNKIAKTLKKDLINSLFELGPNYSERIHKI